MSLENKIMTAMKESMKSKDQTSLRALRAIKSAIILQKTQKGSSDEISNEDELKILQKLVKQRKDSADIYKNQDRMDLAQPELDEIKVIEAFLPEAMSEEEVENEVKKVIDETGAEGMKDMGRVMGIVTKKLMG
ncbi:MAG TPA: GatB/YqeY domain-containing protein, partial [Flavobacteriaceae bacterium]|nr:GatB/YqeY domain-containing protein [Flavobacteriaceae bacterium]